MACEYCKDGFGKELCGSVEDGNVTCVSKHFPDGWFLERWQKCECRETIKINYCPMCGEKLEAEND